MLLHKKNQLDPKLIGKYNVYREKLIKDAVDYEFEINRISEGLGGEMKYNQEYIKLVEQNRKKQLEDREFQSLQCKLEDDTLMMFDELLITKTIKNEKVDIK